MSKTDKMDRFSAHRGETRHGGEALLIWSCTSQQWVAHALDPAARDQEVSPRLWSEMSDADRVLAESLGLRPAVWHHDVG